MLIAEIWWARSGSDIRCSQLSSTTAGRAPVKKSSQTGNTMRNSIVVVCLMLVSAGGSIAGERRFVTGSRMILGDANTLSASARVADLDGNASLDAIVANGRHWPGQNFVHLNQGRAAFNVQRDLGIDRRTSYAAEPADLDGDGDIDIAVGNDRAPNQVFLNDGSGRFQPGSIFGGISSVRSLTVADIDRDGDIDILSTCRGKQNEIFLNDGKGNFSDGNPFGTARDSTIDVAVADWNGDEHLDLILANRDNQQNSILINDGNLNFSSEIPFGTSGEQTRAIAVADLNGDAHPDIVAGNVGQSNRVYLADGEGGFADSIAFGTADGATYSLAIADMDNDNDLDLIAGNVGQQNAVFFNKGDGRNYTEVRFGDAGTATYGLDAGDFDGDKFRDIIVANSQSTNHVFLNRPAANRPAANRPAANQAESAKAASSRVPPHVAKPNRPDGNASTPEGVTGPPEWDPFRSNHSRGVADGFPVRTTWNADASDPAGILWSTPVPGLGHSSPVIRGDRIFVTTAISDDGQAPLKVGRGGQPNAANDNGEQSWVVLCYDRKTGTKIWQKTAHRGAPQATRHVKATHANTSVAIAGDSIVAFFGSEGIYCYDLDGNLRWSQDLGVINISKYGIGWGFASSPVISGDRIAIVCDDPEDPFVATLRLADGKEIWRTSRKEICERSWGTPYIHSSSTRTQVVVNGWPWIMSYDLKSGEELWRIRGGGDNPVPTPFEANGWIYITNAHGSQSPVFVVRPDANGNITPPEDASSNESIVWSTLRGGSYMSTPVVYGDYLYLGNTNGVVRCFHARTGEKIYEERLGTGAAIYSSLIAAEGKLFCASENGIVYVLKSGPTFEILARNQMVNPCFATPAIAEGTLYFRTTRDLVAIQ